MTLRTTYRHAIAGLVLAGVVACLGLPAAAEDSAPAHDPRTAFKEADTDSNGAVDRGEFNARIIEVFYFADTNKDGFLDPEEQGRLVFPEDFTDCDKDGNGRLSLREFLRVRFAGFDQVDTDHDGVLTIDEILVAWDGKADK